MLMFITDVNALGLQTAQGLTLTESFYWDLNDATRAFTKRWQAERNDAEQLAEHDPRRLLSGDAALT